MMDLWRESRVHRVRSADRQRRSRRRRSWTACWRPEATPASRCITDRHRASSRSLYHIHVRMHIGLCTIDNYRRSRHSQSAKTHAGTVFCASWPLTVWLQPKINAFSGLMVEISISSLVISCSGFLYIMRENKQMDRQKNAVEDLYRQRE